MAKLHLKQLAQSGAVDGNTVSYDAASGLWVPRAWTSAYEVDFTAQATLTLSDGAQTIDGKSWTCANNTHATTFVLTNGTGVQIRPKGDSNNRYDNGDRTLPILTVPVSTLWASFDPGQHRLRVWLRFALTNGFNIGNYQGWYGGFEPASAAACREYLAVGSRRDYSRNAMWHMHQNVWAHGYRGTDIAVADGVTALELTPYSSAVGWVKSQSGSDAWPDVSTMTTMGALTLRPALSTDTAPVFGVPSADTSNPSLNVFIGAFGWNYGSMTLTVRRLKLEYQTR